MKFRPRLRPLIALAAILLVFPPAAAQNEDDDDDGIRQSVARVSWLEGEVAFNRGDDPDDWQPAAVNYPMTLGDRIWAARDARVELQLRGGTVYLGPESELAALDLADDVKLLSLTLGTASFRIRRLGRGEVFEVATPNVSVTFETPGTFRIDVDEEGDTRVSVTQGRAWVAAAGGQVELDRGEQIRVWGLDQPDYDVVRLARADRWDRWVEKRARRYRSVRSASYVHADIYGIDDLDAYGSWESHADYGHVWYPKGMASGWEPYRFGRWIWRDPWGWTWLSSEPWGWAPYHYGRWAVVSGRWCWVPVGPKRRYPGWAPAVVGFVGGGTAGGFVGWFPLGPREPFHPWWFHARSAAGSPGFDYAYRRRVTIVSRDVFVRGGRVDRDIVRDTRTVTEVSRSPVLRGPIPVLPTRDSIRVREVGGRGVAESRPPERIARREVVTRRTPPPAPPTFERKLDAIRERGGEPVTPGESRRLAAEERREEPRAQPVRPAGREGVQLTPRGDVRDSRKPQPLLPSGGGPAIGDRPAGRDGTAPTRVPEPRREAEPTRPTPAPRRVDVPTPSPTVPERVPTPRTEVRREPAPTARPVPEATPERRDVVRPPVRTVDRPTPAPTPRAERAPVPEPRRERTETAPAPAMPGRVEVRSPEPKKAEPGDAEAKPTATPTPTKGKAAPRRGSEPEKKPG
jgi:hypothetical protein